MGSQNETKIILGTILITLAVIISIFLLSTLISAAFPPEFPPDNDDFLFFQIILSSINSILLIYLLYNYIHIYTEVKSSFSLGLILLDLALLLNSIASNPVTHTFFGLKGEGLEHFTIIPGIFTLAAALFLIYLSRR